ncbi:MAG: cupin domain-containing protein [Bacteroidales bacterium]
MKINTLTTAEKVPFNLDGRKMFTSEKVEIIHLTLNQGEVLNKHTNPFDVVFYILEGTGIVETDEHSTTVEPDMSIDIKGNIYRGVRNTGDGSLRLLVVKIF